MTDFSTKLDEILTELCKNTQADYGYEKLVPIATDEAKRAIIDLIDKELIGSVRLLTNYYNKETDEYNVDGAISGGSWDDIFEAGSQQTINEQRNILKGGK